MRGVSRLARAEPEHEQLMSRQVFQFTARGQSLPATFSEELKQAIWGQLQVSKIETAGRNRRNYAARLSYR